jgi:hypothetical protein
MGSAAMVFSHPNHEIAVLGTIARTRPHVVFLTDGGGEDRVAQSRSGLSSYLQQESLHFLNHSEASFYDALLAHDVEFLLSVAEQVKVILLQTNARTVYCDSVEFYNPVHDLALPIVRAALGGRDDIPVFEVPLIHQRASDGRLELQRVPSTLESACVWSDLTDEELACKTATLRGNCYQALFDQMGEMILSAIPGHARREQFLPARTTLPGLAAEQVLRYDQRGSALKSSGLVREAITYRNHYAPMFLSLCA